MANSVELEFAAKTDTGMVRPHNEDAITINPQSGFAVLADGMGGYSAGEVASGIAITVTSQLLEEGLRRLQQEQAELRSPPIKQIQQILDDAIQRANDAILAAADAELQYQGMGTTLVAAVLHHDKIAVAHVGDSRAYRFRGRDLVQITRDHSLLQEQIDAGIISPELAPYAQNRNLVTRALGVTPAVEVEIHHHTTEPGDIYLLCSDGMSDMLLPMEITNMLEQYQSSLEDASHALVRRANENGGRDNISVVLVRISSAGKKTASLLDRFLNWAA
jgi:serine/threonine protein phosphatase PrpC